MMIAIPAPEWELFYSMSLSVRRSRFVRGFMVYPPVKSIGQPAPYVHASYVHFGLDPDGSRPTS